MKNNIFINKYVMACAIAIVITLVGFICMSTLPIEQYPNIAPPTVRVSTSYTGADANTIMKSVVQPLEENINGVPGMTYITSSASASGDVSIQVYFEQGTDHDIAAVNVQNRVSRATALLPAEVTKVGVQVMKQQSNILHIGALKSVDGKYDADFIANYIDINVRPRLMRITGVGDVMALGNTYALRIWLKPDVMAQYGLEPNDVFAAIGGQSFVAATGSLGEQSENAYQYSMEYKGTLKTVEEFNDIVLRTSDGGHLLRLSDVAEVEIGAVSYNFTSNIDGKPGTIYMVFQAPGANATEVNARINKLYEELKPTMPAGLEFDHARSAIGSRTAGRPGRVLRRGACPRGLHPTRDAGDCEEGGRAGKEDSRTGELCRGQRLRHDGRTLGKLLCHAHHPTEELERPSGHEPQHHARLWPFRHGLQGHQEC